MICLMMCTSGTCPFPDRCGRVELFQMKKVETNMATAPDSETPVHSQDATRAVINELREFINEAGDGTGLDMWQEIKVGKSTGSSDRAPMTVQLDDGDLSYKLTLTPTESD